MRRSLILIVIFIVIIKFVEAQDPQFSQFYTVPLYLGPSFAGTTKGSRININYRNQWPALGKSFTTMALSFDHYFHKFRSGVGVLLLRDRAGEGRLGITSGGFQYSFDIYINKYWKARPGVHFSYTQRSVDITKLEVPSGTLGGSSTYRLPQEKVLAFDFGTSILTYSENHWFGFSIDHLTRPNLSLYVDEEYRLSLKYQVYGGTRITRRGRLLRTLPESVNASFIFKSQDKHHQLDVGGFWFKEPLMLGLWFRGLPYYKVGEDVKVFSRDALIFMAGYKIESLSIGYSFDATISNLLVTRTAGSHEISIIYKFNQEWERKKRPKRRPVPCPTF
ncbi:MAG: PorP/SprF family type IX secretion system membrane protein [Bacteroidales bacterium]|nr:PorP/SprF family type IX secretion system membrane protein [Bacteroidales bacterium]